MDVSKCTDIQEFMQNAMQILLPLSGHAHLAEPGCLCTKQALGACASKLLEPGYKLAGGPSTFSQQMVWAPKVPPGPLLLSEKGPMICTPVYTRYTRVNWWGRWEAENKEWSMLICQWWDSNP